MEFAQSKETAAEEHLMNCGGDYEKALRRLREIQDEILDRAYAMEGLDEYRRLKEVSQGDFNKTTGDRE